jgi:GntR family transcriptional regulator, transcriptional repressor for pyruvate dehydrogenase complex
MDYEIVKKKNTTGIIVQKLLELIRVRSLKPGDKLPPERELSELMKVSRPSLREALKSLEMMSIINIRQGSGAFVNKLEPESVVEHLDIVFTLDDTLYHDLFKARRVLESAIAGMAAENISDGELKEIEDNIKGAASAIRKPREFLELDFKLHSLILKASRNRILPVFIQSINKLNLMMREKTNGYLKIRRSSVHDHQSILEALRARDPDSAAKAMEEHLFNVEKGYYGLGNEGDEKK